MEVYIFLIGVITASVSFIASMFLGNMIFQSGDLGTLAILISLLIGTLVGCTVAIINTIKDSESCEGQR